MDIFTFPAIRASNVLKMFLIYLLSINVCMTKNLKYHYSPLFYAQNVLPANSLEFDFTKRVYNTCTFVNHHHHAISGVSKTQHCISSLKVAHNSLQRLCFDGLLPCYISW